MNEGQWPEKIRTWARALGFAQCGFARLSVDEAAEHLQTWLAKGMHGDMDYMARHADLRAHPERLVPGALTAIMVTMDYAPQDPQWVDQAWQTLAAPERAYVSRYALGRDYHKVVRQRLAQLARRIENALALEAETKTEPAALGYRVFCDSAPVMEVELARQAGLGWRGKHTLLLSRERGSSFFLGSLLITAPFEADTPAEAHCGTCTRCLDVCPTQAIVAPYQVDARRCISYLTIELKGSIPAEMRPLIGNRIYGCDDCQLACPWNKYAQAAQVPDFAPRHGLEAQGLVQALAWTAQEFDRKTEGSAMRRIGHERWLRNVAVAMGNALRTMNLQGASAERKALQQALQARADDPSALVREHVRWAQTQGTPGA